ncbi:MAG: hypothetical protein KKA07_09975 [Bacteroidetes bacterium]|nr:hypothetical protein [Bacteroidota bacterium]
MVRALGLFFNAVYFLTVPLYCMYICVFFTVGLMAKNLPTTTDFLFRDGQAWFGSQEGKRNEMMHGVLEEEKAQTGILRDMVEQQRQAAALAPYTSPAAPTLHEFQPEINIYGLADELRPEFRDLVYAQQELGDKIDDLGYLGQMTLEEATVHTGLLKSLDKRAQAAFSQRNAALKRMGEAIVEHRLSNGQLAIANYEHQISNRQLALANSEHRLSNRQLSNINQSIDHGAIGVQRAVGLSTAVLSTDLKVLERSLAAALGDIGSDIQNLSAEVVQTRMEVIQAIQDSQAIFLWSHREQMWVRQQILDVLRNPRLTAARETWAIGEKCRLAGNNRDAIRMYRESLNSNPAEARNYVSLGLMSLDVGDSKEAKNYFAQGVRQTDEYILKGTALMHLAKIEMFDKNFSQAKTLLLLAMESDVTNLEVWFDLAVCEMKLGDRNQALYYIRNLLHAPTRLPGQQRQAAAQYALKIVAEASFAPVMQEIRQIMNEIIINNT